jgi:NitT/TauT family transport system ATP-binding protein
VTAITLRNVTQEFESADRSVLALSNVSFDVAEREFVAIVGTSGCGKSTLLRIVAGLMAPSAGEVSVRDRAVRGPDEGVGIVFQSPVLLPWRNVWRNISLQLEARNRDVRASADAIQNLIRLTGLEGFEQSLPYQLSGGMQQRVSMCRALVHDPSLLLMDEPFGALDALTREQMNLELQRIWMQTGKTVLFITHSITEAVFLADRVVVMTPRPGRIKEIVDVPIARPRGLGILRDPDFHEAVDHVRMLLDARGLD